MILRKLTISGFKSYRDSVEVVLDRGAGFYFVSGDNRDNPRLGANAVGKSTIWDALCWVIYGKTLRGLKASNVANWEQQDQCLVELDFSVNDVDYLLRRTWSPNSLTLTQEDADPVKVTQEHVEQLVGYSFVCFANSVVLGQFSDLFFDLSPAQKLSVFADALELDVWLDASDRASKQTRKLRAAIEKAERVLASSRGKLQAHKSTLADNEERAAEYSSEREDRAEAVNDEIKVLRGKAQEQQDSVAEHKHAAKILRDSIDAETERLRSLLSTRETVASERAEIRNKVSGYAARIESLEEQLDRLVSASEEGECPLCRQELSSEHVDEERERLEEKCEELESKAGKLEQKEHRLKRTELKIRDEAKELDKTLTKLERSFQELNQTASRSRAALSRIEGDIENKEHALASLLSDATPYDDTIRKARAQCKAIRGKIKKSKRALSSKRKLLTATEYWVKAFKEIRLWLIEDALRQFEIEVNNSLIDLGLEEWTVKLDVERETKSGTVSRGFSVFIKSPAAPDWVPWEAWSGGETQRLLIAGQAGLANLISSRREVSCNVEVWDEATKHLNAGGLLDLLEFYSTRAQSERRSVYLVDHRSYEYAFDGEILVVKTDLGSVVVDGGNVRLV